MIAKPILPASALFALALSAASAVQAAPAAVVSDAWCRAAAPGALSAGCYLTITAAADDRLVAVESPAASRVEMHSMDMTGGIMRMRKMDDGLALPQGKAVSFGPGGAHLMVIGPKAQLKAGGEFPLTLRFAKAPTQTIKAPVR